MFKDVGEVHLVLVSMYVCLLMSSKVPLVNYLPRLKAAPDLEPCKARLALFPLSQIWFNFKAADFKGLGRRGKESSKAALGASSFSPDAT